ncbi:site-2 protease family protein [Phenylobacterium sp.]|uniref:site-2 protease family protein n=1 Tax=Phenylobacterium sp. TaxID=1871053 RepID=UPI00393353C1
MTTPTEAAAPPPPNNLVGLAILAAVAGLGVALATAATTQTVGPLTFGFVFLGWILAVMAHEFGHAAVAYLAGDHTVREKGYLSFDPRRYGDLGTSLVLPLIALALGGIGFPGGAVWLRHDLMRSPAWRAAASLAGPASTLVVLLVLAFALSLWSRAALPGPLFDAVALLAFLQATALILNLLPIPGLDGFNAIRPFLPKRWGPALRKAEGLGLLILLAALFLLPGFGGLLFGLAAELATALGVPRKAIVRGFDAFQFWR